MQYSDARAKFRQGYDEAVLQLADAADHRETHGAEWSWKFRILKAELYLRQGRAEQSLALLAGDLPSLLPVDLAVRKKLIDSQVLCKLKRAGEAETELSQAEALIPSSIPSARRDLTAELALSRGKCALAAGPPAAKGYYRQAAALAKGGDPFIEARALGTLGYLLLQEHSYQQAIDTLSAALSTTDSPLLREGILGNLGECYAYLGDWRQSISFAEQAEKLAEEVKNISDQEKWLIDLGRAHFALTEFAQAEPYYSQALAIARRQNDTDAVSRCLNDRTQLALRRHNLDTAERYWKEESTLELGNDRKVYVTSDAAGIAIEHKDFLKAEALLREILQSSTNDLPTNDPLRLTKERELGDVYWRENKVVEADRAFRDAIYHAEVVFSSLPPQYQMSFLDEDPFYDSYVRFLVAQDRKLDALKIAERGRAQILSQAFMETHGGRPVFDLAAIQAALKKPKQIALAYSLTNDESFLWVITPAAQPKIFRLPSHEAISKQIDAYNSEIVGRPRPVEDSPSGQKLYKTLIQPAESLIPKGSRVVVIPSKVLSEISFEALVVPGDHPHYWIEDVEVETTSSLALLAHPRPSRRAGYANNKKELFLLGAPTEADPSLPVLKHAEEEIKRIRNHFPPEQEIIVSGPAAVPQAYRASKPGDFRLIHVDAHSVPSVVSPLDSFVVLSPTAGSTYKLYAREIEAERLQAELVTISACYSAGSRWYQGEGIVGLGWAFLRAGAHQVVASLWAVDDASTPQLMDDFYGELSRGIPAARALHDAKLNMLRAGGQRSRPYYWASLQLYTGS